MSDTSVRSSSGYLVLHGLMIIGVNAPWLFYLIIIVACILPFAVVGTLAWYLRPDAVIVALALLSLSLAFIALYYRWRFKHMRREREDYKSRWEHMVEKCRKYRGPFEEVKVRKKNRGFKPADVLDIDL